MGKKAGKKKGVYNESDAWELFNHAITTINFPSNVFVHKKEDHSVSFFISLTAPHGKAGIIYTPDIHHVVEMLNSFRNTSETVVGERMSDEGAYTFVSAVIYGLIKNLHIDLAEAFADSAYLSAFALTEMARKITGRERGNDVADTESDSEKELYRTLDDYFVEKIQKHKSRLMSEIDESDFERAEKKLINHFYSIFLPRWQEAKKCYRLNKRFESWQAMIEIAVPDLPKDLIDRLADPDPYIAMPSSLALEHAARVCGIPSNSLGLRALQNYLKESKEWADEVGTTEVENAVGRYIQKVQSEIVMSYRINDSLGKDERPDFSHLSLLHQQLAPLLHDTIVKVLQDFNESDPLH